MYVTDLGIIHVKDIVAKVATFNVIEYYLYVEP